MKQFVMLMGILLMAQAHGFWSFNKEKQTPVSVPTQISALSTHANDAAKKLRKDKKNPEILAYFDEDGVMVEQGVSKGFYRQLLGRNKAKQAVVQDFYFDNKSPQTNPMIIPNDADLRNFDSAVAQGRVIWYSPQGKMTHFLDYEGGLVQRGGYYDERGVLALETHGDNSKDPNAEIKLRGFYENGKLLFENTQKNDFSESIFYYESGQKMWHGVSTSEAVHAWAKDGKPIDLEDIADEVAKAEKRANQLMMEYLVN